jgi:hypothetical protein
MAGDQAEGDVGGDEHGYRRAGQQPPGRSCPRAAAPADDVEGRIIGHNVNVPTLR